MERDLTKWLNVNLWPVYSTDVKSRQFRDTLPFAICEVAKKNTLSSMYSRNNVADLWVVHYPHYVTLRSGAVKYYASIIHQIFSFASRVWICHSYWVISEAYISPRWYASGNIYWVTSDLCFPIFKTSRVARNRLKDNNHNFLDIQFGAKIGSDICLWTVYQICSSNITVFLE